MIAFAKRSFEPRVSTKDFIEFLGTKFNPEDILEERYTVEICNVDLFEQTDLVSIGYYLALYMQAKKDAAKKPVLKNKVYSWAGLTMNEQSEIIKTFPDIKYAELCKGKYEKLHSGWSINFPPKKIKL
jgi:hypothetical protein